MDLTVLRGDGAKLPLQHELGAGDTPPAAPSDDRDSEAALAELRKCEDWYYESSDSLAECFAEIALDHDYYDHLQWTEEEKAQMLARGQAPLVYNKCSMTIDWITGTERKTRIDMAVHPKTEGAVEAAKAKQKLLKYQSDTNRIPWNRSRAFKDAAIGGVGWTECSIRGDLSQELILHSWVPWQHMKWDPFSRKMDLDDCRYLHRKKWLDLDYAMNEFPGREDLLRMSARSHLFGDEEWGQDQLDLPQVFRRYDSRGSEIVQRRWSGAVPLQGSTHRLRCPVTETWYRVPKRVKKIYGLDLPGVRFDPNDSAMVEALRGGYASLSDAVTEEIRVCTWVPGGVLYRGPSPFHHGRFPFTPVWAKRRDRDGAPYGVIRGIRDAQDDYNKRLSKMQWLLATNQLIHEKGAVDEDKKNEVQRNLAKPSGMVELMPGALSQGRVKIERNVELAEAQTMILEVDAAHIHDGSGVNREMMGRDTNAVSGIAIRSKQEEGAVTTAELFDNLRLHTQLEGSMLLSLNEQYMTLPMQVLIGGDNETKPYDWLHLNDWQLQEDGSWKVKNDITKHDANFVVDQVDFRQSFRAAQAEQFFNMLTELPDDLKVGLLDVAVQMTDIPERDEVVRRIRSITGQGDPGVARDPQAEQQRLQREQAQQQEQELQIRERLAKVGLDEAKTEEIMTKARKARVEGQSASLDLAALIEVLLPLAPAADRLYQPELAANA